MNQKKKWILKVRPKVSKMVFDSSFAEAEFYALGLGQPFPISAANGGGTGCVSSGKGNNHIEINNSTIEGSVTTGNNNNKIDINDSYISKSVMTGSGSDEINIAHSHIGEYKESGRLCGEFDETLKSYNNGIVASTCPLIRLK